MSFYYGLFDLFYDNRFTPDEKASILATHYHEFTTIGIWRDATICIVASVILDLIIYSNLKPKQQNKK